MKPVPLVPDRPLPTSPDVDRAGDGRGRIETPLAPEQEETAPKADAPKVGCRKVEAPKVEAPKVEAPKVEVNAAKPEAPRFPGKVMIMSPGDRVWHDDAPREAAETRQAVRQAPLCRDGGRGGAGDVGGCDRRRAGDRGPRHYAPAARSPRSRRTTARWKPPWRGSMPICSR